MTQAVSFLDVKNIYSCYKLNSLNEKSLFSLFIKTD